MIIKSSASLRNEYPKISAMAKETNEPIYITKNGEGDTVLMSLDAYERMQQLWKLRAHVLEAEQQRLSGAPTMSTEEVIKMLDDRLDAQD